MRFRLLTGVLMASTALSLPGFLHGATAQTADAAAPTSTAPSNTVRTGLGDSQPTDIGRVRAAGANTAIVPTGNGVNRQDAGGGLIVEEDAPKSRSTVTRDFIAKQSPTANPYQLMRLLPGVNTAGNDPWGLNGGNFTMRGRNSDEIGMTIEGAPVNDSGNYALYPQEYTDAENIEQIVVTQGGTDLDAPHYGAAGGTVNIYARDPSKVAGGYAGFSYGTGNAMREFARVESGEIGNSGLRGFLSFSHFGDDHWRGSGTDNRDHVDFKAVDEFGDGNRIGLSLLYNYAVNNSYLNPTMAQWSTGVSGIGPGYGANYLNTYSLATASNYYKLRVNPFQNLIASAPSTFHVSDNVQVDVTPYFWYGYGNGGGENTFSPTGFYDGTQKIVMALNGSTTASAAFYAPSITETYRPGVITKATYSLDGQKIVVGYWFEYAHHRQTGPVTLLNADGSPQNVWGDSNNLVLANGQKFENRDWLTQDITNQIFAGDTINLIGDKLLADVGVRQTFFTRQGNNYLPGATPSASISEAQTLPTAALRYRPDDNNLAYVSVSTGFRAPQNYTLFQTFSNSTGAQTNAVSTAQKPETSISFEIGERYQSKLLDSSITGFATMFQNRQVSSQMIQNGALVPANINAGGEVDMGIDGEIGFHPVANFRPYVSGELLSTKLTDDYQTSGKLGSTTILDYLPTKGKQAVRAPNVQAAVGIDYDDGLFFGNWNTKFEGSQYGDFMNQQKINPVWVSDATLGVHLPEFMLIKAPNLQLNLYNVFDQKYLSGVSTVQTNAASTIGRNGSTIAGSNPAYYVGGRFAAMISISSAF